VTQAIEAKVHALHPTQITVGMIEVHDKMHELRDLKPHQQKEFLEAHPVPGVRGADNTLYITDHHHLARALWELGIEHAFVVVEEQLGLSGAAFWQTLVQSQLAHPIDEHGARQSCVEIPKHVQKLRDDVYRSLAGYVRAAGGFEKTPTPFAEFAWADWFRSRIVVGNGHEDFKKAVAAALQLARSPAARALPGFRGTGNNAAQPPR
jgi:hypothetical protein